MRTRILSRLTAVVAATMVAVLTLTAPAQAGVFGFHYEWGANTAEQSIVVDMTVNFLDSAGDNYYQADLDLAFATASTSANRCRITTYVTFSVGSGTPWNSARKVINCDEAVNGRKNQTVPYSLLTTYTSGTKSVMNMCVDLYYGTSTSSGWQKCAIPKPTVHAS